MGERHSGKEMKAEEQRQKMHIENGKSVSEANRFCEHIANEVSENTVKKIHVENRKSASEASKILDHGSE